MNDDQIAREVASRSSTRERLYAFTHRQVDALKATGLPMKPVSERWIVAGVLEDLRDAGFDVYRPDECVEGRLISLSLNLHQPQRVGFEVVSVHQVPMPPSLAPDGESPTYRLVPVESPKENE